MCNSSRIKKLQTFELFLITPEKKSKADPNDLTKRENSFDLDVSATLKI